MKKYTDEINLNFLQLKEEIKKLSSKQSADKKSLDVANNNLKKLYEMEDKAKNYISFEQKKHELLSSVYAIELDSTHKDNLIKDIYSLYDDFYHSEKIIIESGTDRINSIKDSMEKFSISPEDLETDIFFIQEAIEIANRDLKYFSLDKDHYNKVVIAKELQNELTSLSTELLEKYNENFDKLSTRYDTTNPNIISQKYKLDKKKIAKEDTKAEVNKIASDIDKFIKENKSKYFLNQQIHKIDKILKNLKDKRKTQSRGISGLLNKFNKSSLEKDVYKVREEQLEKISSHTKKLQIK
jgi:hypothetical protein